MCIRNDNIGLISRSSLLQVALEYHRGGFSVFPIEPGTKKPAVINGRRLAWEQFQQRRPTEEEIEVLFGQNDPGGIAVVCGKVSGGLIVVDFDGDEWDKAYDRFFRAFPELEKTRKFSTGSGHINSCFRCPDIPKNLTRIVRKFADIDAEVELRANAHYVLVPPSLHPCGRRYEWLNPEDPILELSLEELEEMIRWFDNRGKRAVGGKNRRQTQETVHHNEKAVTRKAAEYYLKRALAVATPGNRNNTGFWLACQLRDLGLSEAEAEPFIRRYAEAVPQGDELYTENEALASLRSAYKGTPREPAIPGVRKKYAFTPSGKKVVETSINPELAERLLSYHNTDAGNAEAFKALFGDRFCWIPEKGQWFYFDGVRWTEDTEAAQIAMLETARLRGRAAMSLEDDERRSKAVKWSLASESNYKLNAALSIAQAMLKVSYADFDSDPYLLTCANGVIDLQTGELRPAKPEDRLHKSTGIRYDPTATCPRWERFLREIFLSDEDLIDFIWRAIGYTLTGSTSEQCVFICYGTGANGKSTFLSVLESLLGDYGVSTPPTTFKDYQYDRIPNDVARLAGLRYVKSVEMKENIRLNEERIKVLTGGDRITARFLHQEFFDFTPTFKIWLAVNHKPLIKGTDEAIWRRIRLIPFERYFKPEDREPQEKLLAELRAELPGILTWAVKGCLRWQEKGLEPVESVRKATEEYRRESDVIQRFLDECTVRETNAKVRSSELYQAFKKWAEENGEVAMSGQMFGRRMSEKGFRKKRLEKGVHYLGLGLIARDEG